jgi:hypothetical protein
MSEMIRGGTKAGGARSTAAPMRRASAVGSSREPISGAIPLALLGFGASIVAGVYWWKVSRVPILQTEASIGDVPQLYIMSIKWPTTSLRACGKMDGRGCCAQRPGFRHWRVALLDRSTDLEAEPASRATI